MGAAGSTLSLQHLSAQDVGKLVAGLGGKYVEYEKLIIDNAISGEVLFSLSGAETKEILVSIGITNAAHQTILVTHFKKLKGEAAAPTNEASRGGGGSGGGDCCTFHALPDGFRVGEQVTKTPRFIMTKLFEIQGIAVDPTDLDPAVDKIARAVGTGFGDGISKYDCFINYRVAADADLAEKLYLYLKTKGIHAFLDKKCLKNGEKWKDGFLTGLKNSKCFVALISKKALDRVRDKAGDHTWDNVLLEYETALNIMQVTENPKYICPLHVGECNGGNLSKFQDFNPALYPDSITAITDSTPAAPPKPAAIAPKKVVADDDDEEGIPLGGGDDDQDVNFDENGDAVDHVQAIWNGGGDSNDATICCKVCDEGVSKLPPGTWPDGWGCDWPGHEGQNFHFTSADPVYGCPTIMDCNWGVCETCYNNYIATKKDENDENEVLNVPQPEGTKSVYNAAYYCEIKNVRFEEAPPPNNEEYVFMVVEYNVRGDMSLGELQDPSSSRILCGDSDYYASSTKVFLKDKFQNRGELVYHIPIDDIENFATSPVRFTFGEGGYSEAKLVMPNSTLDSQEVQFPFCSNDKHVMIMSDYHEGGYASGYVCDICRESKTGYRWFCKECSSDKCFSCEPMQVCPAATCGHKGSDPHPLDRCSGAKLGGKNCDICRRRQLQFDPEYYHCGSNHNYDLCLECASKQQAKKQSTL